MCGPVVTGGTSGSFDGNNNGTFGGPAPVAQQQAAPVSAASPTFSAQPMLGAPSAPAFQSATQQQPTAPPNSVAGTFSQFGPRPGGSGRVVN